MNATPEAEGWGFPATSRKCHYFVGGMSLCSKWGFYRGPLVPDDGASPDDCAVCRRLLDQRSHGSQES